MQNYFQTTLKYNCSKGYQVNVLSCLDAQSAPAEAEQRKKKNFIKWATQNYHTYLNEAILITAGKSD